MRFVLLLCILQAAGVKGGKAITSCSDIGIGNSGGG